MSIFQVLFLWNNFYYQILYHQSSTREGEPIECTPIVYIRDLWQEIGIHRSEGWLSKCEAQNTGRLEGEDVSRLERHSTAWACCPQAVRMARSREMGEQLQTQWLFGVQLRGDLSLLLKAFWLTKQVLPRTIAHLINLKTICRDFNHIYYVPSEQHLDWITARKCAHATKWPHVPHPSILERTYLLWPTLARP